MENYPKSIREKYLSDPCRYSSLPLYKELQYKKSNISVIHDSEFDQELFVNDLNHRRFFRIMHDLDAIQENKVLGYKIKDFDPKCDIDKAIYIIKESYPNALLSRQEIESMLESRLYRKSLWKFVVEEETDKAVALGICQFDELVSEVIFDWIQVLPNHRGQGIGTMLVSELLLDSSQIADFATVSGDIDNPSTPEKLYRKCGFHGNDIWHIILEK